MKRGASVVLLLVIASPYGLAQEPGDGLNEQQRLGRQIFAQSCGVCHLRPALNVRTYGPLLSKAASGGDERLMRNIILEGTTRMPAFKYYLQSDQVDAIIAYVRTVPPPPAAAAAASPEAAAPPVAAPPD
jgi:mono/diheme cytochrome c family protein